MIRNFLFLLISTSLLSCSSNSEEIIFLSKEVGISRIYKLKDDTSISLVSLNDSKAASPALSPDGKKLAYLSEEFGDWDIRIRTLSSEADSNITKSSALDGPPVWSPDGNKIAYMSYKDGNRDIYVRDLVANSTNRVTFNPAIDVTPLWSETLPNTLYFKSIRNGFEGLYRLNIVDSLVSLISPPSNTNNLAANVPNRGQITYVRFADNLYQLLSFDEQSNETAKILTSPVIIEDYAWANTANYIAIRLASKIEIYAYDGLNLSFLEAIENAENPSWSRSGDVFYYNLNDDLGTQIYSYDLLTQVVKPITPVEYNAYFPIPLK